jgi:hypothetical protein
MTPLFVPKALYDRAKVDPRFKDACERGDIVPVPLMPSTDDIRKVYASDRHP